MPLVNHQEVGKMLKAVRGAAIKRAAVKSNIDRIRGDLDEWVMREFPRDAFDNFFLNEIYYNDASGPLRTSMARAEMNRLLEEAKSILIENYPNCASLRLQLRRADRAINSIRKWRDSPRVRGRNSPAARTA